MQALEPTDNRKVKFRKNHHNTFGLMYGLPEDGGTCPGATKGEGGCLSTRNGKRQTCYMSKITQIYKAVSKRLKHNTDLINSCKSQVELEEILTNTMTTFVKKNPDHLFFRLHYSGDIVNETYAKAWRTVMLKFPQVRFWGYARSFDMLDHWLNIPNLTIYLSADPVNYKAAKIKYEQIKDKGNIALAYLGDPPKSEDNMRFVICPETSGKIKNADELGACAKCRLCVNNYKIKPKNISFKLH